MSGFLRLAIYVGARLASADFNSMSPALAPSLPSSRCTFVIPLNLAPALRRRRHSPVVGVLVAHALQVTPSLTRIVYRRCCLHISIARNLATCPRPSIPSYKGAPPPTQFAHPNRARSVRLLIPLLGRRKSAADVIRPFVL